MAATPYNPLLSAPRLGLAKVVHCTPSQCMARVKLALPVRRLPTAQTSLALNALTALSQPDTVGWGPGMVVHCTPSQCMIRGEVGPKPVPIMPTAHASLGEMTAMPETWLGLPGTLGLSI